MANDDAPGSSDPSEEAAEPRAINEGDEGDAGDFGDDGDDGDFGDEGEGDSAAEIIYEDEVDAVTVFDVADEAADVAADVVADVAVDVSVGDIILDVVAALVLLLAEVDDPSWVNDPARRNTVLAELRPAAEEYTRRGVAPSADELRVLRDRIRARWREREQG